MEVRTRSGVTVAGQLDKDGDTNKFLSYLSGSNTVSPQQFEELVDYLTGTCHSLAEAIYNCGLPEELENDNNFCTDLDERIFCCTGCH